MLLSVAWFIRFFLYCSVIACFVVILHVLDPRYFSLSLGHALRKVVCLPACTIVHGILVRMVTRVFSSQMPLSQCRGLGLSQTAPLFYKLHLDTHEYTAQKWGNDGFVVHTGQERNCASILPRNGSGVNSYFFFSKNSKPSVRPFCTSCSFACLHHRHRRCWSAECCCDAETVEGGDGAGAAARDRCPSDCGDGR